MQGLLKKLQRNSIAESKTQRSAFVVPKSAPQQNGSHITFFRQISRTSFAVRVIDFVHKESL